MPAQSQQQQKLFGLALAFKRGEVKSSEVSDEIKGIADRMSEKEIKKIILMKEQLRKIVREIMREKAISEMNEVAGKEAMGIAALTGTRGSAVEDFINKHELDGKKLFRSIKKANLRGRLNFVSALVGKDGNPNQKLTIKLHKESESVNEGYSTEEKRIVMMAIRKLAKYRSVPIDQSVNDLLGAGAELQRDIKKGKIKK
jgi:hypothetical protein